MEMTWPPVFLPDSARTLAGMRRRGLVFGLLLFSESQAACLGPAADGRVERTYSLS